jgi:hypothetical protein
VWTKRTKSQLDEVNLLDLSPVRCMGWEEEDGRVVVVRTRPADRGWRGLVRRFAYHTSVRRVRLDEIGSFAWKRFDGSVTVAQVAAEMRAEFGERIEPAEERLGTFVRLMRREKLLAYPEWDGTDRSTEVRSA